MPATRSGEQCRGCIAAVTAELAEPGQVVGVQAFDVHDAVPAVAGAVDTRGVLDRVEREPDTGVSRGVRVGLETEPVEFGDHVDELAAGVARPAPNARGGSRSPPASAPCVAR